MSMLAWQPEGGAEAFVPAARVRGNVAEERGRGVGRGVPVGEGVRLGVGVTEGVGEGEGTAMHARLRTRWLKPSARRM